MQSASGRADHAARGGADLRIAARKTAVAGDFRPGGGFHHIDFAEIDHRRQVVAAESPKAPWKSIPRRTTPSGEISQIRRSCHSAGISTRTEVRADSFTSTRNPTDAETPVIGALETGHTVHLPVARSGNRPSIGTPLGIKAGHCCCGKPPRKEESVFSILSGFRKNL